MKLSIHIFIILLTSLFNFANAQEMGIVSGKVVDENFIPVHHAKVILVGSRLGTITDIKGEFELTSLVGNITIKNGNPFVHIHVNVSDEACNAYGGHLFSGTITATGELIIFLSNKKFCPQDFLIGML